MGAGKVPEVGGTVKNLDNGDGIEDTGAMIKVKNICMRWEENECLKGKVVLVGERSS